jgi:hypothetical protein
MEMRERIFAARTGLEVAGSLHSQRTVRPFVASVEMTFSVFFFCRATGRAG